MSVRAVAPSVSVPGGHAVHCVPPVDDPAALYVFAGQAGFTNKQTNKQQKI